VTTSTANETTRSDPATDQIARLIPDRSLAGETYAAQQSARRREVATG
jgi:hypothetical protein